MAKLFDLQAERQARVQHMTGRAGCMHCAHQWQAVAPTGTTWLDCPNCKAEKGVFLGPVACKEPVLTCNCGNQLLYVTRLGAMCPGCGAWPEL